MGQIQNATNQLFGSMIGLGLGVSHSPYMKKKEAYGYADMKIAELEADEDLYFGTRADSLKERVPDISKYDWTDPETNKEITSLYNDLLEHDKRLNEAYEAKNEAIRRYGSKGERKALLEDESDVRTSQDYNAQEKTQAQKVVERLKMAYAGRKQVERAIPERLSLLDRRREGDLPDEKPERRSRYL